MNPSASSASQQGETSEQPADTERIVHTIGSPRMGKTAAMLAMSAALVRTDGRRVADEQPQKTDELAALATRVGNDVAVASRGAHYPLHYLGHPALRTVCQPLESLADLPDGLIAGMRAVVGTRHLGLAANQVGALLRVILVRMPNEPDLHVMFNPVLSRPSASKTLGADACLSIPGYQADTQRHNWLTVTYRDEGWLPKQLDLTGLTARIVQHEVDHLDGKLYIDMLSRQQRRQAERAVEKARGMG